VNQIYEPRNDEEEFVSVICKSLTRPNNLFWGYLRMTPETFNYILSGIQERLTKHSKFRKWVQLVDKFALTLKLGNINFIFCMSELQTT
jgi:hypothetical protein